MSFLSGFIFHVAQTFLFAGSRDILVPRLAQRIGRLESRPNPQAGKPALRHNRKRPNATPSLMTATATANGTIHRATIAPFSEGVFFRPLKFPDTKFGKDRARSPLRGTAGSGVPAPPIAADWEWRHMPAATGTDSCRSRENSASNGTLDTAITTLFNPEQFLRRASQPRSPDFGVLV